MARTGSHCQRIPVSLAIQSPAGMHPRAGAAQPHVPIRKHLPAPGRIRQKATHSTATAVHAGKDAKTRLYPPAESSANPAPDFALIANLSAGWHHHPRERSRGSAQHPRHVEAPYAYPWCAFSTPGPWTMPVVSLQKILGRPNRQARRDSHCNQPRRALIPFDCTPSYIRWPKSLVPDLAISPSRYLQSRVWGFAWSKIGAATIIR